MSKNRRVALMSACLGVVSAFAIPAVLVAFSNTSIGPQPWATLVSGYILAAGSLESFVDHLLPWSQLAPEGGPPAAVALAAVCVLLFWGTLLSLAWYAFLRVRQSRHDL
jgi:hypothetical protein